MASGINIAIDVDESGATKGITKVDEALEKVADSLDGVGKDGTSDLGKLETSIKDVNREALKAGDDIKSGFGNKVKSGVKEAEGGLQDFKSEANSTAKESAASFDGSAESIIDSFQEIAANAFQGFGAAGAVAGLAMAAGIGIATAAFQRSEEEAQKAKTRIGELGLAMVEAGTDGTLPLQSITENLQNIITNSEDAVKGFKDISQASKTAGTNASKIAMAYAGNKEAIEGQMEALDSLIKKQQEEVDLAAENGSRFAVVSEAKLKALQLQQTDLKKVQEETQAAADIEQTWLESGGAEIAAKAAAIETIDAAYDESVGSISDFLDKESGVIDIQGFIDSMQARRDALAQYQDDLANMGLTTGQKQALNDMGQESAALYLASLKAASPAQKQFLLDSLTEAAKTSSGAAKGVLDKAFEKPTKAKVEAVADTAEAERTLDALIRNRTAKVEITYVDRYGKKVY